MPAALSQEVDLVQLGESRLTLRLAWTALEASSPPCHSVTPRSRPVRPIVTPEQLFTALDNRTVHARHEPLRLEVFAVRDEAGQRWVQLALHGKDSTRHLTLRLKTGDTAQHAVMMLAAWVTNPAAVPDVFNVA